MPFIVSNMTVGQQKLKMFPYLLSIVIVITVFTWKINL